MTPRKQKLLWLLLPVTVCAVLMRVELMFMYTGSYRPWWLGLPLGGIAGLIAGLIGWAIANWAERKGNKWFGYFLLATFGSPLITLIVVAIMRKKPQTENPPS